MSCRRLLLPCLLAIGCQRAGTDEAVAPPPPSAEASPADPVSEPEPAPAAEDRPGYYLGRELAPTMTFHGADWLTRDERDDEENTTLMHQQLGLSDGDVACDIGAGNGYHTLKMARAVAPSGKVLAVDIQPQMLDLLDARAKEAGITNVQRVLSEQTDPKLPAGACDLILLVDVYHELEDPAAMLGHLRRALSPTGRIALLEFREEDPDVPIKALHKMSKAQILREYEANGLKLSAEFDGLPWQHLMFFSATR